MSEEAHIAHLGFIQAIITRMGANSFLLKGWSVTLVAGLFALAAKDARQSFMLIAYFPVFTFWLLDAWFLRQERLYRKLYDAVVARSPAIPEFSLNATVMEGQVDSMLRIARSKTLLPFHGTIVAVVLLAMFVLVPMSR